MILRESNRLHGDSGLSVQTYKSISGRWVKNLFYVLRIRVFKIYLRQLFHLMLILIQHWTANSRMSSLFPVYGSYTHNMLYDFWSIQAFKWCYEKSALINLDYRVICYKNRLFIIRDDSTRAENGFA